MHTIVLPSLWHVRGRPGNALDNAGLPVARTQTIILQVVYFRLCVNRNFNTFFDADLPEPNRIFGLLNLSIILIIHLCTRSRLATSCPILVEWVWRELEQCLNKPSLIFVASSAQKHKIWQEKLILCTQTNNPWVIFMWEIVSSLPDNISMRWPKKRTPPRVQKPANKKKNSYQGKSTFVAFCSVLLLSFVENEFYFFRVLQATNCEVIIILPFR